MNESGAARVRAQLAHRIYARSRWTGEFVLRSGALSDEYYDKYLFESDPLLLRDVAQALTGLLPAGLDGLAGLELGGVPLATVCSQLTGLPTLFVRKQPKEYGTRRLAEGGQVAGRTLAVIEDVITSGGQVIESCRRLRDEGARIAAVLCVIDRENGGRRHLGDAQLQLCALFTHNELYQEAASPDALIAPNASLVEIVETVRALSYGRPNDRTVAGMLRERRGTCSTKHLFLADTLVSRFPETEPHLVHRVYKLTPSRASELFGTVTAALVPETGLVDVHRYLTIVIEGHRVTIDATFPGGPSWDGRSAMVLACGDGVDYLAGDDPDASKRELEEAHCDPLTREPFIASLASH